MAREAVILRQLLARVRCVSFNYIVDAVDGMLRQE